MFLFAIIICMIGALITWNKYQEESEKLKEQTIEKIRIVEETEKKNVEIPEKPAPINLGEFKLTAYCSCYKCCGRWALNRPKDENGKEIVRGSIGERLFEGVSIAVDPSVIPYGTKVIINGNTYIAQDTGEDIKGKRIDVYHNNHQVAKKFGVQYAEVFIEP